MKRKSIDFAYQTFLLTAGSALCALAVNSFLIPQGFLACGFTGIALLINYQYPVLSVGVLYLLINIPVFILGYRLIGRRFVLYSFWGMAIYSLMLSVVNLRLDVNDMMLSALIAGALSGVGSAVILRSYGSSGGAEILFVIVNKYFAITLGVGAIIINAIILAIMALFFPLQNVLFTFVYVAVSMQMTNVAFHGLAKRKAALIISDRWQKIANLLTNVHHCGDTLISGRGGYQGSEKMVLYSVINRKKVSALKKAVLEIDAGAFIALMVAEDVTGLEIGNQPHW